MPKTPSTRRTFLGAVSAVPAAAAAATRVPIVVPTVLAPDIQISTDSLKIVTTYKFEPSEIARIKAVNPKVPIEVVVCSSPAEFREKVKDAEVVFGDLDAESLKAATKCKWLQSREAGVEKLDPALRASDIVVTNYQRTFAHGISETAIGLLLSLTRGISRYYVPQFSKRQMRAVGTAKSADHVEITGRTMGIVGMGGIGSMLARRAHYGFDMKIVATEAKPLPKPDFVAELHDKAWFPTMAQQVDVLVAAAPHTPITERMFNESIFRSMKKTAYFLALSRGMLYDDMALVKALKEGWIAGAGLDVFPVEPPPSSHPIFDCSNVVMTAHTAGWSPDRQIRYVDDFAENVRRYTTGQPLMKVVDKQAGY
jgi:phosphoglycerate dehydrogenase-like enzyme